MEISLENLYVDIGTWRVNQFCNVICVEGFRFEEESNYEDERFFSRILVKSEPRKASLYIFFTRKDNTVVLVEGEQND